MSSTEIKSFAQAFSTPALLVKAACRVQRTESLVGVKGKALNIQRSLPLLL